MHTCALHAWLHLQSLSLSPSLLLSLTHTAGLNFEQTLYTTWIFVYPCSVECIHVEPKLITKHQWLVHTLYRQKYWDTPFFRTEKMHFQICGKQRWNIIHVFKNCISISVATVLEVSKMTEPICTSHWCLVMSFWLKVCIYSHIRGVKLGLGLGFMQTSQVLPHWLNQ